ncbi:hypothetical protein [Ferruginibacter sp.]|nr:hypothetical protein [Ferruginibacter sp.]
MTIKNYCFIILLVPFFSCTGQTRWDSYADEKGEFKIEFKGKPSVKTAPQQFPFANVTWTITIVDKPDKNNLSYLVKYADFPVNIISSDSLQLLQEFFIFTQADLSPTLGETGLDNINLKQVQKYPGREFRWIDRPNKLGYTRRTFLVNNRLYFLEVKYNIENDFNNDIEGFLDKFTLIKKLDNTNPEITAEKPIKKFEANFPGKTKTRDNPTFHELFGNTYAMLEAYETPKDQIDLPATKNIMYGVNYVNLPAVKLKTVSTEQVRAFVTKAFTDNIKNQSNGKILFQKEINLNGYWGIEGQGTMINGMVVMHLRSFIVNDYYYQVIVMCKNGAQNNKEALNFLNSFKLKKE